MGPHVQARGPGGGEEEQEAGEDARAGAEAENPEFQRGGARLYEGKRPPGGVALPRLQEARLRRGLPGRREDPGIHQEGQGGRLHGRHPHHKGDEQPSRRMRPRLPPGVAVREQVRARKEGGAHRGRPARAVRRQTTSWRHGEVQDARKAEAHGQKGGDHRRRAFGPDRGGGAGEDWVTR